MHFGKFDEKRYPNRKCPYGFTCDLHPWGINKITKDCKYYSDCKRIVRKLIKVSDEQKRHKGYIDEIAEDSGECGDKASTDKRAYCYTGTYEQTSLLLKAIEQHERAVFFLRERGNHQSRESLGVDEQISLAQKSLKQLESKLRTFNRGYIAPEGVKMKAYNQQQQPKTYNYYKLQSTTAQFKPERKANPKCKIFKSLF